MKPPHGRLASVALAALLTACASASPTPTMPATPSPEPTIRPTPSPSAEQTPGPTTTVEPTPEPIAADPPPIGLAQVASGLAAPIGITPTPDGWLLVNERGGRVVAIDPGSGETAVVVDLSDRVLGNGEQGLLGLVLHPGWPDAPRAFVHYTNRGGDSVFAELAGRQEAGAAPVLDAGSERVLLTVDDPYANHNGGQLAFGPDGYLYAALGDGGSGGDPHGHGQNAATLLGSILRFDVDAGGDAPYAIPTENPFADGAGGAPEVFLYGLRNPWRFSFDRATGQLWIADVGQNAYEEVDRVDPVADAGANLGWNLMEASHCFVAGCSPDGLVLPLAEYGRDAGCSVSGGYVYRGSAIDGLGGWYLFSDYCSGLVFGIPSDVTELTGPDLLLESGLSVSSFGEGADGELYLADINGGGIYRIVPGG